MNPCSYARLISPFFAIAAWYGAAIAQTSGLSATLVLRSQAASIAEESISKFEQSMTGVDRVGIRVEGGSARSLIENAFLELLNRRGLRGTLLGTQGNPGDVIHVIVLDQSVRYFGLSSGEYKREIQTALEARAASGDSSSVQYLGMFKRQDIDTVAFREEGALVGIPRDGERTLFDRLLGPVILIGGAFLVVYLLFTVRN